MSILIYIYIYALIYLLLTIIEQVAKNTAQLETTSEQQSEHVVLPSQTAFWPSMEGFTIWLYIYLLIDWWMNKIK